MTVLPIDRTVNFFELPPNEAARVMIESNYWTTDQEIQLAACEEYDRERHHVSEKGECSGGCSESKLIDLNGKQVCKWTRMECPKQKLNLIIERYSRVNRRKLDV